MHKAPAIFKETCSRHTYSAFKRGKQNAKKEKPERIDPDAKARMDFEKN